MTWVVVLFGEASIAAEVDHNPRYMHTQVERGSHLPLHAHYGSHCTISVKFDSQVKPEMPRLLVPSQHRKWDDVLKGEMPIAAEVFQSIPLVHKNDGKILW